jgi:hypothetical protein
VETGASIVSGGGNHENAVLCATGQRLFKVKIRGRDCYFLAGTHIYDVNFMLKSKSNSSRQIQLRRRPRPRIRRSRKEYW